MKEIPLAKGKSVTIIDDEDFELVSKYRWTRCPMNKWNKIYVQTSTEPRITLHRLLMGFPEKPLVVDHKNHDGLDNRRCNLRVITKKQNQGNRRSARNSSSKFLGVSKNKRNGKFTAQIGLGNKKTKCLGFFENEIDAALAYNEAAKIVHGEFANLNIIQL
jgi:hypothetical protein